MKAEVDAILARLRATGRSAYFVDVPASPAFPYFLVWSSSGAPGLEKAVDETNDDINDLLGVTSVAATPDGVLTVQASARAALNPGAKPSDLGVAGRSALLKLEDSRPLDVDRDVTITATGRHPAFGVDIYRLISVPT